MYIKIEFSSQRSEMLLFLTTKMAVVTSRANQQYGVHIRSEKPFYHTSVADLWRFKQLSESLLNEKNDFFS